MCVMLVTFGVVLFGAVLAGAAIGALAAVVIHGRGRAGYGRGGYGRLACGRWGCSLGFSLVTSGTMLIVEAGGPAYRGATGQGPEQKAPARLRLPR